MADYSELRRNVLQSAKDLLQCTIKLSIKKRKEENQPNPALDKAIFNAIGKIKEVDEAIINIQ